MQATSRVLGALLMCGTVLAASAPVAALNVDQRKCQEAVAREGGKYVKAHLKERIKCANKNLGETGSCDLAKRDAKLDKAESKLRAGIDKRCGERAFGGGNNVANTLKVIGFPGKCGDADPSDGFTDDDLEDCIFDTHTAGAEDLFDVEFGANGADGVLDFKTRTGSPATGKRLSKCQRSIATSGHKYLLAVLKAIQSCRNLLNAGQLAGIQPDDCPASIAAAERIAAAESKVVVSITARCTDTDIPLLDVCSGSPPGTVGDAIACILASHYQGAEDLISIEYPETEAGICGDGIVNDPLQAVVGAQHLGAPPEECDAPDDGACPGACGEPTSAFACLCTDVPRLRVVEHENADLDIGWTGTSHDQAVVEGGGYVVDLYDCDGPGGPDTVCTAGPSCALPPNQPCVADADCAGPGNACRKRPTAVGPYCNLDVQQPCAGSGDCPGMGNFCRKQPHGIPLPLSSGGIAVCVVNVFSESVAGTIDVATGALAARLRQDSVTHLTGDTQNQPCPTCGGFCDGAKSQNAVDGRTLCQSDAGCPPGVACIQDAICAFGPRQDLRCRRDFPFGHDTLLMGTPSVDCPPPPGADISGGGLDILFDPITTDDVLLRPSFACNAFGFADKKCILGPDTGRTCVADSDCSSGGAGSCAEQCFCPLLGGLSQQPNACSSACRGGSNDYAPCSADSQCPGGFCQTSSCRAAAGVCISGTAIGDACSGDSDCPGGGTCGDDDSSGEGFCPAGPLNGQCSFTDIKGCIGDDDCRSPACSFCLGDDSETCIFENRNCFVNEGIAREGAEGVLDSIGVAIFCVPGSGAAPVNAVAGIAGPGALEQPMTTMLTGF